MNDLTARLDPPKEENEDFEAERMEYEDEHGVANWGADCKLFITKYHSVHGSFVGCYNSFKRQSRSSS